MLYEHELWAKDPKNKNRIEMTRVTPMGSRKVKLETYKRHVAEWERRVRLAKPRNKQLLHLINKFGGIVPFSLAVGRHPDAVIYNWLGVSKKGVVRTDRSGLLTMGYIVRLTQVARSFGILLTPEDLFPDLIEEGRVKNPYTNPELKSWWKAMEPDVKLQQLETQIAELLEE